MTGYQLALDLGPLASTPPAEPRELPRLDIDLVVCYLCTGRHPVERCPAHTRHACELCAGDHLTSRHHVEAR